VTPACPLSGAHGQGFTGNGDVLAFAIAATARSTASAARIAVGEIPAVGPWIAGIMGLREEPVLEDGWSSRKA
jgi:hypothetical protein